MHAAAGAQAVLAAREVARVELLRRGAEVRVAMTESATRFVGPITFTGLTGRPPITDLFDPTGQAAGTEVTINIPLI